MAFDEFCGCDPFRLAVFGDGVKQCFLFFRDVREDFAEYRVVRCNHRVDGGTYGFERAFLSFGGVGKGFVEGFLNVVCVSFKEAVNFFHMPGCDLPVAFLKMADDERDVDLGFDGFQFQHVRAVVEGACRRGEHLLHHVAFAAGENEVAVACILDVCAQKGFYVFFRVFGDLLEFVDCYDAWFVRICQVAENFIQGIFRTHDVAQLDRKSVV